ncbi:HAMP domain-containing methyl-accepting chemotaxis protein [Thiomicrospira microaerophila]|uniref:HAMP domain-containing methyl-accepting chemotaxis protein n=1 Tax=Thiomicrospira microaerophila TaxID=406020 RepID=UPI0006962139|nr:methyl-accepting chemotaxis protein [Thiomicrospira microaerophila]
MSFIKNLKIGTRLSILVSALLIGLVLSGIFSVSSLMNLRASLLNFSDVRMPGIISLGYMNTERMEIRSQTLTVLLYEHNFDSKEQLKALLDERARSWEVIDENWQVFSSLPRQTQRGVEAFQRLSSEYEAWRRIYVELDDLIVNIVNNSNPEEHQYLMMQYRNAVARMVPLSNTMGTTFDQLVDNNADTSKKEALLAVEGAQSSIIKMVGIVILASLFSFLMSLLIVRSIKLPLAELLRVLMTVDKTGSFLHRVNYVSKDEVGQMAQAFNRLLSNTDRAISEANTVVGAIAKGRFDQRITADLKGDLNTLKQGVNGSANSIDFTMSELGKVMQALYNGDFNVQMDDRVEGEFRTLVQSAMSAMSATVGDIIHVMDKMENGDFHYRVEVEARGDLLKLKNSINNSMESMSTAISKISEVVAAQAAGDLTVALPAGHFKGELHKLKNSINYSMDKLKEVVLAVSEAAHIVNGASHEVSQGSLDLSQRVQEQAAALEQTSATMDEMNSVVQSNTQNALQTAQVAKEVQTKAHQGAAVMQQTIEAMNSIQESSHKIADIVTLIDGIAFQTNLLALNAAVEAARAGEHGRGFAVVAGEVRALAQKSADAAKDIKGLINESVGRIDQGTKLASESGEVLQGINQAINGVAEMINQIAQASGEQADGIKQVHNAIAQIDGVTQQNAALVEETSAASESLSEQASILQQDMAFFKTGKAASTAAVRQSSPKPAPKTLAKPAAQASAKSGLPTAPARRPQATAGDTKGNSNEWSEF